MYPSIMESDFKITTTPIPDTDNKLMNEIDKKDFMQISSSLVHHKVNNYMVTLSKLLKLKEKYPEHKRIYNLIGICYQILGDSDSLEKIIIETYQRFPNYLFAKTGYVSYWMSKNDYSKFEEVFDGKYNLKSIYPSRDEFHVTEAITFFFVCGRYFASKRKLSIAKKYKNMIFELSPSSREVMILHQDILSAQRMRK